MNHKQIEVNFVAHINLYSNLNQSNIVLSVSRWSSSICGSLWVTVSYYNSFCFTNIRENRPYLLFIGIVGKIHKFN